MNFYYCFFKKEPGAALFCRFTHTAKIYGEELRLSADLRHRESLKKTINLIPITACCLWQNDFAESQTFFLRSWQHRSSPTEASAEFVRQKGGRRYCTI
jgi:hypothetical protein